eukprot:TRINITY_DN7499_c0_g1_i15.p1 TRINITY_DN7499_c0_g1~~TRINITY_DN7499_c0_g1_i15.p1  ORF type:complete len:547 (-),score=44.29 TRINITY_DN7499_c0_g1_i15:312-1817(-)
MSGTNFLEGFKDNVMDLLLGLLIQLHPKQSLSIMLDGPAPLSKLSLQRVRRVATFARGMTSKKRKLKRRNNRRSRGGIQHRSGRFNEDGTVTGLSVLGITPGTMFMSQVHVIIEEIITEILLMDDWKHLTIRFSDSCEAGEGEIKIVKQVQKDYEHNPNEVHVVVGSDSDLILLSMASGNPNVFVLQGTWRRDLMSQHSLVNLWGSDRSHFLDFVMLIIMSFGNDYLPGIKGVASSSILGVYRRLRELQEYKETSLTQCGQDGTITFNWPMLQELFQKIGVLKKQNPVSMQNYYVKTCQNYFIQLRWNLQMYVKGSCDDYLINFDLRNISSHHISAFFASAQFQDVNNFKFQFNLPLLPFACGIAMLPIGAHGLLPPVVHNFYEEKYLNSKSKTLKKTHFYTIESILKDLDEIVAFYKQNVSEENSHEVLSKDFTSMSIYYNYSEEQGLQFINRQPLRYQNGNARLINVNKFRSIPPQVVQKEKIPIKAKLNCNVQQLLCL